MKLTRGERRLLEALASVQYGRLLTANLKPATRACAKRLRMRGLLSKKNRAFAEILQAGRIAIRS